MTGEQAMTAPGAQDFYGDLNAVYAKHLGGAVSQQPVNTPQAQSNLPVGDAPVQNIQPVQAPEPVVTPEPVQAPQSDPVTNPDELDKKLQNDIDNDRKRMQEVDDLLDWMNQEKEKKAESPEPQVDTGEPKKELEMPEDNNNNPNGEEEEIGSGLTDEEIVTLIDTAETLEQNLIKAQAEKRHLLTENALLEERAKSYLEKYQSLKMDETRVSIPDELALLVRYHQAAQSGDETMSKIQKERYLRELISLTEKGYGRDLSSYVSDSHAYGQEDIDKGSISQYNIASQRKVANNQSDDFMMNAF